MIDKSLMVVDSFDDDAPGAVINVAGPAALIVAKLHKLGERVDVPDRLNDKDAYDIYRLLVAIETSDLAAAVRRLLADELSREATTRALDFIEKLFAAGPEALGSMMAGRAEEGIGQPVIGIPPLRRATVACLAGPSTRRRPRWARACWRA